MNGRRISITIAAIGAALIPALGAAQAPGMSPGKYELTTTILSVDMPGAPPSVAQAMAGRPVTTTICITPEQAAKGQVGAPTQAKDCTQVKASLAGGHLDTQMTCNMNGGSMTVSDVGTYSSTGFDFTGKVVMTGRASMSETMKMSAKKVGPC